MLGRRLLLGLHLAVLEHFHALVGQRIEASRTCDGRVTRYAVGRRRGFNELLLEKKVVTYLCKLFFMDSSSDSASMMSCLYFMSASRSALSSAFSLSAMVIKCGSLALPKISEFERFDNGDVL